jgi:two-component system, NarL family, sensor histidine kinase DevS
VVGSSPRRMMVIGAAAGELPKGLVGEGVDLRDSVAAAALRTMRTLRLEDEPNRARFERHGLGRLGVRAKAGLVVPLVFRGRGYGVLIAVDRLRGGPAFTAEDVRLLEAFAASAATAIATAESVEAERRRQRLAAAEQERAHWARELHDETLQNLAALRISLAVQAKRGTPETLLETVNQVVSELDEEIAGLRSLITDLRPATLDDMGARAALEDLGERAARRGLEVDLNIDLAYEQGRETERHTDEFETAVYRIVQEALNNARTHGGAQHAVVEITEDDTSVSLTVRDYGCGFHPAAQTSGFGLAGMRERAELLHGTLNVSSAPGQGTTVSAVLPARRRNRAQVA